MKWLRRYWLYVVLVLLLLVNGIAWWQRQWLGDWWRLRDYEPPQEITSLADNISMTSKARHLFYINHPALESKQGFNQHCADMDEETAILGCYHGDRQGIYLYAVQDPRLHGVQEVTAAHEMLHQAYDRLSAKERKRIDALLLDYYNHGLAENDVKQKIDNYKKQSDVVLVNEMHSIFGSEVRNLPPALETYYKQYFTDRLKVVGLSEAYRGEFDRREQLVKQYDAELTSLKGQIDANKADLDRRLATLHATERTINAAFASQDSAAYREAVISYNNQVGTYNTKVGTTRQLIQQYNSIVVQRNEIATEEQKLQQALDSQLAPK